MAEKKYALIPHSAGELAYYDTLVAGMVPCKVLRVENDGRRVTIQVTATRKAYKVGDRVTDSAYHVVPRTSVVRRRFTTRILTNYRWVDSCV